MNRQRILPSLFVGVMILAAGCDKAASDSIVPMKIGTKTYNLEIAADEKSREHGLMERDTLASDGGMIFVFDAGDRVQTFWMHHTRFDLDIVFLDDNGKDVGAVTLDKNDNPIRDKQGNIVPADTMKAYDEKTVTASATPAKYAIELPAGAVKATGIKVGDVLTIPDKLKAKPATAVATRP
jgi:uncharacterized membrane protein (UPF0127 family)